MTHPRKNIGNKGLQQVVSIRAALPEDFALLLPMVREFHKLEQLELSEDERRAVIKRLLGDAGWGKIWLIFSGTELAGYIAICIGFSIEFKGNDAFVDEFFVVPDLRGQGIGGRVLDLVQDQARRMGIRALHLEVDRSNTRARRLYAAAQFTAREDYMLMTRLL